jgi:hypothetical protein
MTIIYLTLLLTVHYLTGNGLLHLFNLELSRPKKVALSFLTGIVIASFVPFLLQLAYVAISFSTVWASLLTVCGVMNISQIRELKRQTFRDANFRLLPRFKIYEWPFMILFGMMLIASLWRSFYQPVVARDMLSGPEVIAEYAVREHTMINSFFTVNLETTNNHHKPPFIIGLQIIYKLIGFPFGQIWVSIVAIVFTIFLYQLLRERVHALIACTLLLFFFAIPELYAYTYVMLFDYSNMVFFFVAVYFLQQYFVTAQKRSFYFSALLFAFATFIRLETLVFAAMMVPMTWLHVYRKKESLKGIFSLSIMLVALPFVVYFLWVNIYLKYYMPAQFHLDQQINSNLSDLTPLFTRFKEMHSKLLLGEYSRPLWAYFILVFLLIVAFDLVMFRRIKKESLTWYYAIAVIYFGLPLLGYLLPLMDLLNTTKRGLFKIFPLTLLIMANTTLLQKLSLRITHWEIAPEPMAKVKQAPKRAGKRR